MDPCFAIIDRNTLSSMALKHVLQEIFNHVEVFAYNSIEDFIRDSNRHFVHFFVCSDIYFSNADEFETLKEQTTILTPGPAGRLAMTGCGIIEVSQPAELIIKQLERIKPTGRHTLAQNASTEHRGGMQSLSKREKDVLRLIVKGRINKEIASELDISLPTAIFHRNNICDKLRTRSVGKLTVMAVLSGLVDINEI